MAGKAVAMGKTRPVEKPWLTIELGSGIGGQPTNLDRLAGTVWTFKVLKAYTADPTVQFARWFCAVQSPYTFGGFEMGDTYVSQIKGGVITQRDPSVPDEALPVWLRGKA